MVRIVSASAISDMEFKKHTHVCLFKSRLGYSVIHFTIAKKVEGLKCIKDEVSHVLVHICVDYSPIKIVNHTSSIHYLRAICKQDQDIYSDFTQTEPKIKVVRKLQNPVPRYPVKLQCTRLIVIIVGSLKRVILKFSMFS